MRFIKTLKKNIKIFIVSGSLQLELRKVFRRKKDALFNEILGTPNDKIENINYLKKKYDLNLKKEYFLVTPKQIG